MFERWLAKRLINDIKGWEKGNNILIRELPFKLVHLLLVLWYNDNISKNQFYNFLDRQLEYQNLKKIQVSEKDA